MNTSYLIMVIAAFAIFSIIRGLMTSGKNREKLRQNLAVSESQEKEDQLKEPCTVTISRPSSLAGMAMDYEISLNNVVLGLLTNNSELKSTTLFRKNIISCSSFKKSMVFEIDNNGPVVIRFKQIDSKGLNLEIESGAREIKI